ncbi:MAG: HD domain-containing protein [Acidobacteria bacterium]|nr:HD domain-containing protein [Acidobacteriota bacterium]
MSMPATTTAASTPRDTRVLSRYVAAVTALGLFTIAQSLTSLLTMPRPAEWMLFSGLAIAFGRLSLRVPGVPVHASMSDTFLLTSAVLFGPAPATVAMAADGFILSWRRGHSADRMLFNAANPALSVWLGAQAFLATLGRSPLASDVVSLETLVGPLAVMAVVHFLVHSGITATAAALERGGHPVEVWRNHFAMLAVSQAASASAALILTLLARQFGVLALAAAAPLVVIVYLGLHSRFGRLADAERHVKQVDRLYMSTIQALSSAIDAKDGVTSSHIRRVQTYSVALARALGVSAPDEVKAIEAAALLHDTGKLAVPEHILNKPGKLTAAEFEAMKLHVDVGADILSSIEFPYPVVPIVRAHHENWDGTGYPRGLKGDDIPIGARILSVVDCYDALTSDRPYRPAMTQEQATAIVVERRGTMYDPRVVDTFLELLPSLGKVVETEPNLGRAMHKLAAARDAAATTAPAAPAAAPAPVLLAPQTALESVSRLLAGPPRVADVASLIALDLKAMSPSTEFVFYVTSPGAERLVAEYATREHPGGLGYDAIPLGERVSGWVAANRQQIINSDARLDLGTSASMTTLRYCVATPLVDDGQTTGVLAAYSDTPLAAEVAHQLALVAPQLAGALARAAAGVPPRQAKAHLSRPSLRVAASR